MAVSTKRKNISKSKSKTFSKSRKHFNKSRKSGMKTRKMRGGARPRTSQSFLPGKGKVVALVTPRYKLQPRKFGFPGSETYKLNSVSTSNAHTGNNENNGNNFNNVNENMFGFHNKYVNNETWI